MPSSFNRKLIEEEIASLIGAVDGVENFGREQLKVDSLEDIVTKAQEEQAEYVQFWVMRRINGVTETDQNSNLVDNCHVHYIWTWEIQLFWGYIEGASEEHFQQLIDDVLWDMKDQRTYNDLSFGIEAPMMLESIRDEEQFGVYGSVAVFRISAREVVDSTPT